LAASPRLAVIEPRPASIDSRAAIETIDPLASAIDDRAPETDIRARALAIDFEAPVIELRAVRFATATQGLTLVPHSAQLELFCPSYTLTQLMDVS
jgi:hypothetical protein